MPNRVANLGLSDECTFGIRTLPQPEGGRLCPMGEPLSVSDDRLSHTPRMTEEEREAAIVRAAAAQARHDVLWMLTGCFAAKGDADRARRLKELLIAGRSTPKA